MEKLVKITVNVTNFQYIYRNFPGKRPPPSPNFMKYVFQSLLNMTPG